MKVSKTLVAIAVTAVTVLSGSLVWAQSGKQTAQEKPACCVEKAA